MDEKFKVLVVDDIQENLKLVKRALTSFGYDLVVATSGEEAIEVFKAEKPNGVLMDVMLPGIDGYETTRRIREISGDYWVPIIFLSALGQSVDMVRGLESGGDDYMSKPIDISLLMAKMKAMQRIFSMQSELRATSVKLTEYRERAEEENEMAHELMAGMIRSASQELPGLEVWEQSGEQFSGDLALFRTAPTGYIYILHADSMGHGLTAALPLLPMAQTFQDMTQQGFSVSRIAQKMNQEIRNLMPVGRFVATTIIGIDAGNAIFEVWNGGNPPVLLVTTEGETIHSFESQHTALGMMSHEDFDSSTQIRQSQDVDRLMLFSDGLSDAKGKEGDRLGEEVIFEIISQGGDMHKNIVDRVSSHIDANEEQDDISLISLSI